MYAQECQVCPSSHRDCGLIHTVISLFLLALDTEPWIKKLHWAFPAQIWLDIILISILGLSPTLLHLPHVILNPMLVIPVWPPDLILHSLLEVSMHHFLSTLFSSNPRRNLERWHENFCHYSLQIHHRENPAKISALSPPIPYSREWIQSLHYPLTSIAMPSYALLKKTVIIANI